MDFIKIFEKISKNDAGIAGGKGASLGEMTQAGIPVPPGFVITADAYDQFLSETDLHAQIQAELDAANINNVNSVEMASEKIRAIFEATPIPTNLEKAFLKSFEELNAEFVAVRSSATAEDSSTASWAGELESYLYVTKSTLMSSIKKCWSSLFTPRAIFYRAEKGLKNTKVAVAVVVQRMVASEVSGVCFTVHPVTKDPNQLIIEAGWGLGEAIVGGLITPDSYIIDKTNHNIIDTYISEQSKKIIRKPEGGTEESEVSSEDSERQKLSKNHILELSKIALKIEKHYKIPMDIEWAMADGKIWIVQARPITTL